MNIPQRLQNRSSFRRKAEELSTLLPPDFQHRQSIIYFPSPPWQQSSSNEGRIASVPGIAGRADDTNLRRQCSLTTIASYQADYVIFTDGSASRGTRNGGAAAFVTRGSPLQLEIITTIKTKGRKKRVPWNLHYLGNLPTATILQPPYSFTQTVSPCVKFSSHPIPEHFQSTIPSTLYHPLFSSNGSLAILPFQVTI